MLKDIWVYYKLTKDGSIHMMVISYPATNLWIDVDAVEKTIAIALKNENVYSCWW
jgi:hypothetical protein